MSSKHHEMQAVIRQYRDQTGETDVDMEKVVRFAVQKFNWPLPKPADPYELLAREFAKAAREEIKYDEITGKPYRVNHVFQARPGERRLWMDIDSAKTTRPKMLKSVSMRREQIVGDGLLLSYDVDHWNSVNPDEEPIQLELDFTDDIAWRKNAASRAEEEEIAS